MRYNPADFFAAIILFALVNGPTDRPPGFIFKLIVGKCRGEQPLPRKPERNSARIDRNPSPSPLFRNVCSRSAPQVGSSTRSPGSVVMSTHRSMTFGVVCTT